jgi:hypothetical protein
MSVILAIGQLKQKDFALESVWATQEIKANLDLMIWSDEQFYEVYSKITLLLSSTSWFLLFSVL